jgi:hypothetical protein
MRSRQSFLSNLLVGEPPEERLERMALLHERIKEARAGVLPGERVADASTAEEHEGARAEVTIELPRATTGHGAFSATTAIRTSSGSSTTGEEADPMEASSATSSTTSSALPPPRGGIVRTPMAPTGRACTLHAIRALFSLWRVHCVRGAGAR